MAVINDQTLDELRQLRGVTGYSLEVWPDVHERASYHLTENDTEQHTSGGSAIYGLNSRWLYADRMLKTLI